MYRNIDCKACKRQKRRLTCEVLGVDLGKTALDVTDPPVAMRSNYKRSLLSYQINVSKIPVFVQLIY